MALQIQPSCFSSSHGLMNTPSTSSSSSSLSPSTFIPLSRRSIIRKRNVHTDAASVFTRFVVQSSGGGGGGGSRWEEWSKKPLLPASAPCLSDILWPSAGAFAAMALLGRLDQMIAHRGLHFTIAPVGAVCAVLFTAPNSPAAQKYNMFMAQIGCAAAGVLAFSAFGPGWLARATALASSIAFMTITGATHPPAASLPILFIDGAKFHGLNLWYALFPGAASCLILCFIQEIVVYLKNNCKF